MKKKKTTVEIIAPTVDEAIEQGLDQLGLPHDAVEVKILDEGHQGFLGLGSRQVRVQLIVKEEDRFQANNLAPSSSSLDTNTIDTDFSLDGEDKDKIEKSKDMAIEVVRELVGRMKVNAEVSGRIIEPEDDKDRMMLLVDISGKDLSVLIGRRSETLNSLQYIASLILCDKVCEWVPLMIDVQGYRFRRERQLRQLARRLADQVVETGRKQVLEPMAANERRIIHLELRYHPFVTTESVGEEPNRRTTIILKQK
jgi:spoIIIJ-associated protein